MKNSKLQHLSPAVSENLIILYRIDLRKTDKERADDVRQQAAEYIISKGLALVMALRHARAQVKRDSRSSGFVEFDSEREDMLPLSETISAPVQEEMERWRIEILCESNETMLDLMRNRAATSSRARLRTVRRGQQVTQENIKKADDQRRFNEGKKGGVQGGLFGWDERISGKEDHA